MLRRWLSPAPLEDFLRADLGRAPLARPGAARDVLEWFDWPVLDQLLEARCPPPDVLVATRGRLVDTPEPRSLTEARQIMAREQGVVIRRAERHEPRLAQLARAFADDLPGRVQVQVYATPAGTQAFGWHFDAEDVFIVQVVGTKDYYMRQNTVARSADVSGAEFELVRRETSPLLVARLIPGDWLYIPARWWHLVHSVEDALSISIGVLPDLTRIRPSDAPSSVHPEKA
jgi:ribosomal protein L16 Arg81 hydroxylase